jgi:Uma2 family endonuclease
MNIQRQNIDRVSLADFEEMSADKPWDEKWELIDGRVYKMMVGAAWEHKQIVLNLTLAVNNHLRASGSKCRGYDESFWLRDKSQDLGVFPDLLVFCGPLKPGQTSIDDPIILLEVVSKGSQARDRLTKRIAYQQLPSLQHYILVERDSVMIDHYIRRADGWHGEPPLAQLTAALHLAAIELTLSLSEIYRDVFSADMN